MRSLVPAQRSPSRATSMSTLTARASSFSRCSMPSAGIPASRSMSSRQALASNNASRPRAPTAPRMYCSPSISGGSRTPCGPASRNQSSPTYSIRSWRPNIAIQRATGTASPCARVVYASKDRVKETTLNYEDLSDPKWKGKICIRSGQYIYNNALFAAFFAHHGEAKTEEWLSGLKANLAQKPSGGDREVARDIAAGKCDIGVANTYYWALMLNNEPDRKAWAQATKVILPSFQNGGTHVNLSAVVLARYAPNKGNAMKLIEWLVGEEAQHMYADLNYEYPVRPGITVNSTIAGYGKLNADTIPLSKIADHKKAAANLVDKVGFDN